MVTVLMLCDLISCDLRLGIRFLHHDHTDLFGDAHGGASGAALLPAAAAVAAVSASASVPAGALAAPRGEPATMSHTPATTAEYCGTDVTE